MAGAPLRSLATSMAVLTAARAMQAGLGVLVLPVLARFISPDQFGLVALASPFLFLAMAMSDFGLGQSLVLIDRSDNETWSSAFWLTITIGGLLCVLLLSLAWPAAALLGAAPLASILAALAFMPLLQGLCAPFSAELQQRERFGQLAAADAAGALAGAVAAIVLAMAGWGAWAIVAQQIVFGALRAPILIGASKFRPSWVWRWRLLGEQIRFGRDTLGSAVVNFLSRQVDPLVIAKMIGIAAVGFYAFAYRIMLLPGQLVAAPSQGILFTKFVQLRDDAPAIRQVLLGSARVLAIIVFPPMALAAAASGAYFEVFFPARWAPAAPLFAMLAATGAIQSVTTLFGAMLMAIGRTGLRLRLNTEFAVLWVIALPLLATQGVGAVALGYSIVYALASLRSFKLFLAPIGLSVRVFLSAIAAPGLISVLAIAGHWTACTVLHVTPLQSVILSIWAIGCAYAALWIVCRRRVLTDIDALRSIVARPQERAQ